MDIELGLMTGVDLLLEDLHLIMQQPTIKEISLLGEKEFFSALQLICIDKKNYSNVEDKNLLEQVNNFQLFMRIIQEKSLVKQKQNIMLCFDLLFPNYQVVIIPNRTLMFNSEKENTMIDEQNFELFQSKIKQVFKLEGNEEDAFNPVDKRAAEIAAKLKRGRERVAKEKATKGEGINSIKQYLSIITIAIPSMSLKDACDLTIYQLYTLIERYGLYVNWDLDVRTGLAGGNPDQHPDNWMKNI